MMEHAAVAAMASHVREVSSEIVVVYMVGVDPLRPTAHPALASHHSEVAGICELGNKHGWNLWQRCDL
jgi:hypothetical protein